MTKLKTFFIDQHGCAKNQVDGELIVSRLLEMGLKFVVEPERADLIIINTCGFIESAKKESFDALFAARKSYPHAKIALCGCLAERYANELKDALPEADAIFGNGDISRIGDIVSALEKDERPVNVYEQIGVCSGVRKILLGYKGSAFVKVTEGCSNHCSFCAIPLIRGELRSRHASEIVHEVKQLVGSGIVEINLIGQDLASYGRGKNDDVFGERDGDDRLATRNKDASNGKNSVGDGNAGDGETANDRKFAVDENDGEKSTGDEKSALLRLLELLCEIEGSFFIRLLYIHPDNFPRDILPLIQREQKILPYFDIPFQSGDDAVIRAMNRRGTAKVYQSLVSDIRSALPNAVLRTTFLTGFPGEGEGAFNNTELFLKNIKSDWSGCFAFSREEGTSAYSMKKRVPAKTAKARAMRLSEIQQEITRSSLKKWIGTSLDVLIEEVIDGGEGLAIGRAWFQAPDVDGNVVVRYEKDNEAEDAAVRVGRFVRVKITASSDVDVDSIFESDSEKNPDSTHFTHAAGDCTCRSARSTLSDRFASDSDFSLHFATE